MVDLPSSVWSVCPVLVVAAPPPGALELGLISAGLGLGLASDVGTAGGVAGGGDSLPLLFLTGPAIAGLVASGSVASRMGVLIGSLAAADVDG